MHLLTPSSNFLNLLSATKKHKKEKSPSHHKDTKGFPKSSTELSYKN